MDWLFVCWRSQWTHRKNDSIISFLPAITKVHMLQWNIGQHLNMCEYIIWDEEKTVIKGNGDTKVICNSHCARNQINQALETRSRLGRLALPVNGKCHRQPEARGFIVKTKIISSLLPCFKRCFDSALVITFSKSRTVPYRLWHFSSARHYNTCNMSGLQSHEVSCFLLFYLLSRITCHFNGWCNWRERTEEKCGGKTD